MLKLMKLELAKKGKNVIRNNILTTLIIGLGCFVFLFLMLKIDFIQMFIPASAEVMEDAQELKNQFGTTPEVLVNMLVGLSYLIFAAVCYATYVVNGVKNKELEQMFLYPIKRTKILSSKILLAFLTSACSFIICYWLIALGLHLVGVEYIFTIKNLLRAIVDGILIAVIGLLPMIIGIWRKSPIATIVGGVVIAILMYGNIGTFMIQDLPFINYVLAGAILIFALYELNKIKAADFLN